MAVAWLRPTKRSLGKAGRQESAKALADGATEPSSLGRAQLVMCVRGSSRRDCGHPEDQAATACRQNRVARDGQCRSIPQDQIDYRCIRRLITFMANTFAASSTQIPSKVSSEYQARHLWRLSACPLQHLGRYTTSAISVTTIASNRIRRAMRTGALLKGISGKRLTYRRINKHHEATL